MDAGQRRLVDSVPHRHRDRGVTESLLKLTERHTRLRAVYGVGVTEIEEPNVVQPGG